MHDRSQIEHGERGESMPCLLPFLSLPSVSSSVPLCLCGETLYYFAALAKLASAAFQLTTFHHASM